MPTSNHITIVLVCDDHYIMMLAALLKSIEINHLSNEQICVYIVDDHIKESNKAKVLSSIDSRKLVIHYVPIAELIPKESLLPIDNSSFPLNIYARLFIPDWVSSKIQKVLYLDVDMIFRNDISELWETDLGGATIAAVLDKSKHFSNSWAGIPNYRDLNFPAETKYFNSGLLMIDIEKWKQQNIQQWVLSSVKDNLQFADYPDQYGLNIVFANKWLELDKSWNTQSGSESENPYVIHFTGRKPIYTSYINSRDYNKIYREEFYKYLSLTKWKDFTPINEYRRLLKKLYIQLRKNSVFAKL